MQNALAVVAIADELAIDDESIKRGLGAFQGIGRRLQRYGEFSVGGHNVTLVDDYGHHPREIAATLQAIRACWPERRLVTVFQPHRFTRTRDLFEDFTQVLSDLDSLVMLDIYSAGEKPIPGADARSLCRAIRNRGQVDPVFIEHTDQVAGTLDNLLQDGDLVLTLGAGTVGTIAPALVEYWGAQQLPLADSGGAQ